MVKGVWIRHATLCESDMPLYVNQTYHFMWIRHATLCESDMPLYVNQTCYSMWIRHATLWMKLYLKLCLQRPNLKKFKIVFNISRFKPMLNWKRFLADLRRGLNSLNSNSVLLDKKPDFDTRSFNIMKHELMKKGLNQMQIIHKALKMNKSFWHEKDI